MVTACAELFPTVEYAHVGVPTYPSGSIGFILCSKDGAAGSVRKPKRTPEADAALRFYCPDVHEAAFVLPRFAAEELEAARAAGGLASRAGKSQIDRG